MRLKSIVFVLLLVSFLIPFSAHGHGMSEADKIRAEGGGVLEFLRQGAVHMITGYDHLLFLFGVVFFLSKFKDIVKFVTAFTLGHCITLISATFLTLLLLPVVYSLLDDLKKVPGWVGRKLGRRPLAADEG